MADIREARTGKDTPPEVIGPPASEQLPPGLARRVIYGDPNRLASADRDYVGKTPHGTDLDTVPIAERALEMALPGARDLLATAGRPHAEVHPDHETRARVDHGRWIADCPFCSGAQLTSRHDRRFICNSCLNAGAAGKAVRVVWPRNADAIEAVLVKRPLLDTRLWIPGETIDDLRRENRDHGLPE